MGELCAFPERHRVPVTGGEHITILTEAVASDLANLIGGHIKEALRLSQPRTQEDRERRILYALETQGMVRVLTALGPDTQAQVSTIIQERFGLSLPRIAGGIQ